MCCKSFLESCRDRHNFVRSTRARSPVHRQTVISDVAGTRVVGGQGSYDSLKTRILLLPSPDEEFAVIKIVSRKASRHDALYSIVHIEDQQAR